MAHTSVLLHEAIGGLEIQPGDIIVDGTLGSGGHSEEIAKRFGSDIRIIGIDIDEEAIRRSKEKLESYPAKFDFVQGNFRNIDAILDSLGLVKVNKILLDIGLSSNQFEESGRGFSFRKDEPLRMTFKANPAEEETTADMIVNEWSRETIEIIIRGYGEERYARRIAEGIAEARKAKPIKTTNELVDVILKSTPRAYHHGRIHPATRTFQALRIAVNDELKALEEGIRKGFDRLAPGGRMAVISFHSLEDRIVKNYFRDQAKEGGILITKKPIVPGDGEIEKNPRSRSAKLRILMKK